MPTNKNFLLRMIKLNELFRTGRAYTISELLDRVSEYIADKTGAEGISERSLREDIRFMREHFQAPIKVRNGRYFYADPQFSVFGDIRPEEVEMLVETADILENIPLPFKRQFMEWVNDLVYRTGFKADYMFFPFVLLENNERYTGLKWIPAIYEAIEQNRKIHIDYDSFDGEGDFEDVVRPYLLREHRNRWFLIGKPESRPEPFFTIPLDRIHSVKNTEDFFDPEEEKQRIIQMFDEVLGVTYIKENPLEEIELEFRDKAIGYVLTKPIHHSQRILLQEPGRMVITLRLRVNYELKQAILNYVPNVRVRKPKYLHQMMVEMLREGLAYMTEGDPGK